MSVFFADGFQCLQNFADRPEQLAILKRRKPKNAAAFFNKLSSLSFGIIGDITKAEALEDIKFTLGDDIPSAVQEEPFFGIWLEDMAQVCSLFCELEQSDSIRMWVGSKRGCRRYHVDNVPCRLLVTYDGTGTEWLPDQAADRDAFARGEPNENIVRDNTAVRFIEQWDIAIFRGGAAGLLHRTPDDALHGQSVLMRLDNKAFGKAMNP